MLKRILFTVHSSLFSKAIAFTLAETLIVMGIIGVVAALTLPNLNSSTGDKEKVAKVKKIYSNLNDAFARAQAVYGPYDEWKLGNNGGGSWDDFKKGSERIMEFMKVSKSCGTNPEGGCKTSGYPHNIDGTEPASGEDGCTYILADGTSIEMMPFPDYIYIIVDIDGPNKGPYCEGKDVFRFGSDEDSTFENGLYPDGYINGACSACYASWVIQNGNMDYLKTTKLTIDKASKCPNGIALDWTTNTSCK